VSISCANEDEKRKIKEDFTITLRRLLKQGKTGKTFQFITVPDHLAEKIVDQDDAQQVRLKARGHFIIYGRVRERTINKTPYHFLNLDGIVAHNPIPEKTSQRLSKEFSELLPRKVQIARENDMFSFEFTSEWTSFVAKYIIGIASALSGDLTYAENLHKDVSVMLSDKDDNFPIYRRLRDRLPERLSEIYEARASALYDKWTSSHDQNLITRLGDELEKIEPKFCERYRTILLRSLFLFLSSRDTNAAIAVLNKCNSKILENIVWRFNLAFLHAYDGNLQEALRQYSRIKEYHSVEAIALAQIEEFICWILGEEPEKHQFYFCLGYINWQMKGDLQQAEDDFEKFLSYSSNGEFVREYKMVDSWLQQIRSVKEREQIYIEA
jgi:tetratricopeptide (TPR) repeat protein